jgi:hypothetical protein
VRKQALKPVLSALLHGERRAVRSHGVPQQSGPAGMVAGRANELVDFSTLMVIIRCIGTHSGAWTIGQIDSETTQRKHIT